MRTVFFSAEIQSNTFKRVPLRFMEDVSSLLHQLINATKHNDPTIFVETAFGKMCLMNQKSLNLVSLEKQNISCKITMHQSTDS